jgi:hypothetical protein
MQGALIFSGALVVFVLAVNPFFVNWWVGPAQYAGITLTVAMTSMMLLRHWNVATIYTLFCFGYERQLSLIALADGIVTVLATVWLVPKLGMVGAPIASALGAVLVALPFNIRSAAAEMNLGIVGFLRPCLTLAGAISVAVALAAYGSFWLDPSRLLPTVAFALIALTVYGAVVAPFIVLGPLKPYAVTALSMVAARQPRDQTAVA